MVLMYTFSTSKIIEFPSRGNGGVIPDPRIKGTLPIEETINDIVRGYTTSLVREIDEHTEKTRIINQLEEILHKLETPSRIRRGRIKTNAYRETKRLAEQLRLTTNLAEIMKCAVNNTNDYLYRAIFPPRNKGDLPLRRCRFNDFNKYFNRPDVFDILLKNIGLDYIFVLNKVAAYSLGTEKWQKIMGKILFCDIELFDEITTKITNSLKSNNMEDGWQMFVEAKNLTGHRLYPWPTFNEKQSTLELASGGVQKHLYTTFSTTLKRVLNESPKIDNTLKSLHEFIDSGDWITAGSSSVGRLTVETHYKYSNEFIEIRCKKNMLPDVYTTDELWLMCMQPSPQVATAFVKPETGKCRIAVCSDLPSYLRMAYIVYRAKYIYKKWSNVARNYSGSEKFMMNKKIIELCEQNCFGMAWDYAGFERQVETSNLVDILNLLIEKAEINIRPNEKEEWQILTQNTIDSFKDSVIISLDKTKFKVTGGLPSGLLLTSICGDAYNKVMTENAIYILDKLGITTLDLKDIKITGDDSTLMSFNVKYLQLIDYIMTLEGAEAGIGKFGIIQGSTEFLRVSYDRKGAHGYYCRALPTLIQRKPWSDKPINVTSTLEATIEAINTVKRRGGNCEWLVERVISEWAKARSVSREFITTPRLCGGLGIGPPLLNTKVSSHLNKFKNPKILTPLTKTLWRRNKWLEVSENFGIQISQSEANIEAIEDTTNIINSDAIPKVNKINDEYWRSKLRDSQLIVKKLLPLSIKFDTFQFDTDMISMLTNGNIEQLTNYAMFSRIKGDLSKMRRLVKYQLLSTTQLVSINFPEFANAQKVLLHLNKNEREDYLLGELPTTVSYYNPSITEFVSKMAANQLHISKVPRGRLTDIWLQLCKFVVAKLEQYGIASKYFSW